MKTRDWRPEMGREVNFQLSVEERMEGKEDDDSDYICGGDVCDGDVCDAYDFL